MGFSSKRVSLLPIRFLNHSCANSRTPDLLIFTAACFVCALLLFIAVPAAAVQGSAASDVSPSAGDEIPIPILAYHNIAEELPQGDRGYYVTVEQFEKQLDVIEKYGYTTIHLRDLLAYRSGAFEMPEKPVIITFDDGYEGVYKYAYPALKQRGMTATFFILTGYTGENNGDRKQNDWDPGAPVSSHMTWEEIEELYEGGFEIGSHTVDHENLVTVYEDGIEKGDFTWLDEELNDSKEAINTHLKQDPPLFLAYPFGEGADDDRIKTAVRDAGYQGAVGFGVDDILQFPADPSSQDIDFFNLPRLQVTSSHSLALDARNPYLWFMNKLDRDFYPNLDNFSVKTFDADGQQRSAFFPGETVTISVTGLNWGTSVDVAANLLIYGEHGLVYDSRSAVPSAEVRAHFPYYLDGNQTFNYTWTIPDSLDVVGSYSYQLIVKDQYDLLEFYFGPEVPQEIFAVNPYVVNLYNIYLPAVSR